MIVAINITKYQYTKNMKILRFIYFLNNHNTNKIQLLILLYKKILTDHSLISSSHWVSEQSTVRNWSHNFSEMGTFKLAFIQVTIKVYIK